MKKIFLSVALVGITFASAQKKEIAAAVKAVESGDISGTKTQLSAAEGLMGDKTYLLEPSVLEQYYYAKGLSLLKSGNALEGATYLAKISDLGKSKIYVGKDSSKNKVYFVGEAAKNASGIEGLKEETYTPTLVGKIGAAISPISEAANKIAADSFNSKNYAVAAPKFQEVYNLLKAAGQDNKLYLYYAALSYAQTDKKAEAIKIYNQLIDSGYTGSETNYIAINKKSGKPENLDKSAWELYKKMGESADYNNFKTEVSESKEPEFYETNAELLLEADRGDEAVALLDKGIKKFPTNVRLADLQGRAYLKAGKMDDFVKNLRNQIAKNPTEPINYYNLGIMLSKDPAKMTEAIDAFKKATELKPNYADAWQNLAYATIGDDSKAVDDINAARKAQKTELATQLLEARRARAAAAVPYAEKWYQVDSNNIEAVRLLKGLYQTGKNDVKSAEFKAKEEAMKATQK